jgi:hypothetical protein
LQFDVAGNYLDNIQPAFDVLNWRRKHKIYATPFSCVYLVPTS